MKKLLIAALILIIVLVFINPTFSANETNTIIPGVSVGPVKIGKHLSPDILKILGTPNETIYTNGDKNYPEYYWEDIIVYINDNTDKENVYTITVYGPKYETKSGIRVGDTFDYVNKNYLDNCNRLGHAELQTLQEKYIWKCPGMDLEFNKVTNRLVRIKIYK